MTIDPCFTLQHDNVWARLSAEQEAVLGRGSAGEGLEVLQREHGERQRRAVTLARAVAELALAPPAARGTCCHVCHVLSRVTMSPVPGVAVSVLRAAGGVVRAALGPGHGLRSVGRRLAAALARACSRPHTSPTCRDSVVVITCTQETRQAEGGGEEQHHHHTSCCAHPGQGSSGH